MFPTSQSMAIGVLKVLHTPSIYGALPIYRFSHYPSPLWGPHFQTLEKFWIWFAARKNSIKKPDMETDVMTDVALNVVDLFYLSPTWYNFWCEIFTKLLYFKYEIECTFSESSISSIFLRYQIKKWKWIHTVTYNEQLNH